MSNKYIYVGDNRIVPHRTTDQIATDIAILHAIVFDNIKDIVRKPTDMTPIKVKGDHNWQLHQRLEEGKDFEFKNTSVPFPFPTRGFKIVTVAVPISNKLESMIQDIERLNKELKKAYTPEELSELFKSEELNPGEKQNDPMPTMNFWGGFNEQDAVKYSDDLEAWKARNQSKEGSDQSGQDEENIIAPLLKQGEVVGDEKKVDLELLLSSVSAILAFDKNLHADTNKSLQKLKNTIMLMMGKDLVPGVQEDSIPIVSHSSGSSNPDEQKSVRCTICGKEFTDVETKGINRCPNCGTKSVPCAISEDVSIKINWHELRILVIWAEQWGRHIDKYPEEVEKQKTEPYNHLYAIMCIAQRLQRQFPDKTPLTLFSEIKEIAKKYDIETNYKDEELGI